MTTSQIIEDIKPMNDTSLRTPLIDNILPQLFYKNVKTTMQNKNVFQIILGETFTFLA